MANKGLTLSEIQNVLKSKGIKTKLPERTDYIKLNNGKGIWELNHAIYIESEYTERKDDLRIKLVFDDNKMAKYIAGIIRQSSEPRIYEYVGEVLEKCNLPGISEKINGFANKSKDKEMRRLLTNVLTAPLYTDMNLSTHVFDKLGIISMLSDSLLVSGNRYSINMRNQDLLEDTGEIRKFIKKYGKDEPAFLLATLKFSGNDDERYFSKILDGTLEVANFADRFYNQESTTIGNGLSKAKEYFAKLF